jgi:hypothetical protein
LKRPISQQPAKIQDLGRTVRNAALLTLDKNGKHLGEGFDPECRQWGLSSGWITKNMGIWACVCPKPHGQASRRRKRQMGLVPGRAAAADYEKFLTPIERASPPAAIGLTGDSQEQMLADGTGDDHA